jgi:hypothetical protein
MARYVILAQSEVTASALGAWIELLGDEVPAMGDARRIVWDRGYTNATESVHAYEHLVGALSHAIKDDSVHHPQGSIAVLVDSVNPGEMSAIAEGGSWNHLLAMLILTFPEIRWHFGCFPKDWVENKKDADWERHTLSALIAFQPWDPTFDPTGLRDWIRKQTTESLGKINSGMKLCQRPKLAAAIDEETDYARVHGLTAYRFGLRTDLVTTWAGMDERFGKGKMKHDYQVLLEDMSLNFPDRQPETHLLNLETERSAACSALKDENDTSEHRILITTGQSEPGKDTLRENRRFLRAKSVGQGRAVFKPASGMFDLWKQAGLLRRHPQRNRTGNYDGFVWPPDKPAPESEGEADGSNHGAPGKLLMIADQLLHRAECLHDNIHEAADAVLGAVLATDALELTGGRTPTTALQALALKHEFEVMAECRFSGVEYHIAVKPRLREIDTEIDAIGIWFHASQRSRAVLNARMHIFSRLVNVFRDHHQFDEEQICMNRARSIHNTLWLRQKPVRYVIAPLLRYVELLVSSFSVFSAVLAFWVLGLTGLYWMFHEPSLHGFLRAAEDAVTSFFSIGGPIHHDPQLDKSPGYVSVICLAVFSGFIHLGVFISHLYSMLARK